jgi:hypothetical protein
VNDDRRGWIFPKVPASVLTSMSFLLRVYLLAFFEFVLFNHLLFSAEYINYILYYCKGLPEMEVWTSMHRYMIYQYLGLPFL